MKRLNVLLLFLGSCFTNILFNAQASNLLEKTSASNDNPLPQANPKNYYSATHRRKLDYLYFKSVGQLISDKLYGDGISDTKPVSSLSFNKLPINNIVLLGTLKQRQKLKRWLHDIAIVPKGYHTLKHIEASGHRLTIKHSDAAGLSSGRTIAPMTHNLTNGKGADVTIIFDATMSDRGTHRAFGSKSKLIEFNAQQNLFHELAHAMHKMQGTWRYFDSEAQAIEEENKFRIDLAVINGAKANLRYSTQGIRISKIGLRGIGYPLRGH